MVGKPCQVILTKHDRDSLLNVIILVPLYIFTYIYHLSVYLTPLMNTENISLNILVNDIIQHVCSQRVQDFIIILH